MYESDDKMVSHPDHYQGKDGMEVINVIEAFTDDLTGIEAIDTGNIIKYILRWKKKGGVQDIEKVIWYATHLRDVLKQKEERKKPEDGIDALNEVTDWNPTGLGMVKNFAASTTETLFGSFDNN